MTRHLSLAPQTEIRKALERGDIVRHKSSGITMVVLDTSSRRTSSPMRCIGCAWVADNKRYEDAFDPAELEQANECTAKVEKGPDDPAEAP